MSPLPTGYQAYLIINPVTTYCVRRYVYPFLLKLLFLFQPIPGSSTTKCETKSLSGQPESQAKLVSEGTEPLHKKVDPTPSKDATDDVQERPQPRQPKNFFER